MNYLIYNWNTPSGRPGLQLHWMLLNVYALKSAFHVAVLRSYCNSLSISNTITYKCKLTVGHFALKVHQVFWHILCIWKRLLGMENWHYLELTVYNNSVRGILIALYRLFSLCAVRQAAKTVFYHIHHHCSSGFPECYSTVVKWNIFCICILP